MLESLQVAWNSEGYEVTYLKPDSTGHDRGASRCCDAVREDTVLVSMMLVNNETGCVFPVAEAAKLLRDSGQRRPAPLRRGAGLFEGAL